MEEEARRCKVNLVHLRSFERHVIHYTCRLAHDHFWGRCWRRTDLIGTIFDHMSRMFGELVPSGWSPANSKLARVLNRRKLVSCDQNRWYHFSSKSIGLPNRNKWFQVFYRFYLKFETYPSKQVPYFLEHETYFAYPHNFHGWFQGLSRFYLYS